MPWLLATYFLLAVVLTISFLKESRDKWQRKVIYVTILMLFGPIMMLILFIRSASNDIK